jgi:hypothetical protein
VKKRYLTLLLAIAVSLSLFCGCSKPGEEDPIMAYLGDYSYSDPAICMVYERVEDETDDDGNPLYGIQYRKVTDLDGLKASGITLLIYFYSSMDNGSAMVTASVEDIALSYNGKLTVLMLDAMEYKDLMDKYEIEAVPEFVLIRKGQSDKVFGGMSREYWTVNDVLSWLQENGIS